MGSRAKNNYTVLVIIQSSWGEVDWILPTLSALAAEGSSLYAYFPNESVLEKGKQYKDLADKLGQVCCAVYNRVRLKEECSGDAAGLLNDRERLLNCLGGKCDFIFHDYSGNDFSPYYKVFPDARIFIFPHGTFRYSHAQRQLVSVVRSGLSYASIKPEATLLVGSKEDVPYFREVTDLKDIREVGYPKLSGDWVSTMHRCHAPGERGGRPSVLLLSIPARKIHCGRSRWHMTTAIETLLRHNVKVVIRTHPRQEQGELEEVLSGLPSDDISFTSMSVIRASCSVDFALSFPSSAIMDCIAAGIPVVEFFDYKGQGWLTFAQKEGSPTSIYRELGLAAAADSESDLDAMVSRLVRDNEARQAMYQAQRRALDSLRGPENGVEIILQAMSQRFGAGSGRDS